MFTIFENNKHIESQNKAAKEVVNSLFSLVQAEGEQVTISAQTNISKERIIHNKLAVVREGIIIGKFQNKKLFFLDEGDLIGLEDIYTEDPDYTLHTEGATKCIVYDLPNLTEKIRNNEQAFKLWNKLVSIQMQMTTRLAGLLIKGELATEPSIKLYKEGDTIIEQGTTAKEVYSLMSGHANVFVGETKVGEILPDELFGALAALTDTPRTASVIASCETMVLSLPSEHFSELISGRPETVQQLVKDMARTIVSLNKKVVGFNSQLT